MKITLKCGMCAALIFNVFEKCIYLITNSKQ